jgi:hypothetical protein
MSENSSQNNNLYAARNLIFSIIGIVGSVGLIGLFVLSFGFNQLLGVDMSMMTPTYDLIWFLVFFTLLVIPFLIVSIYQLMKKPLPNWLKFPQLKGLHFGIVIILWGLVLLVSFLLGLSGSVFWLISPFLKMLAIAIPLLLIILYLANRFKLNNPSRNWGIISFSVVFTEPLTIMMEIFLVVIFLIAVGVSGDWSQLLGNDAFVYLQRLMYGMNNPDILSRIATPFLSEPVILFIVFSLFSVVIPMLEEIMKPLALWFLNKKNLSERDGFFYGAMTGMVFALIESVIGLSSFAMDSWVSLSVVRLGTGILHIFTAALMGWALTSSWKKDKFEKLVLIYLACVLVHGVWNFMAIGISLNELVAFANFSFYGTLRILLPVLMVLMTVGMMFAIFRITKMLTVENQSHLYE